jgi:hypothetical protein
MKDDDNETDYRIDHYRERHRVDVYEARTRRAVGSLTLDGPASGGGGACHPSVVSPGDESDGDPGERDFGPTPEAIQEAVAELVAG